MTPYLRDQTHDRTLTAVCVETVRARDSYLVLDQSGGVPLLREMDAGQSLGEVSRDIATGQYDALEGPVAVFRASLADCEFEDYTGHAAVLVANYISENAEDLEDPLWNCPFLDNAFPGWKDIYMGGWKQEYEANQEYQDNKRFHARWGT